MPIKSEKMKLNLALGSQIAEATKFKDSLGTFGTGKAKQYTNTFFPKLK